MSGGAAAVLLLLWRETASRVAGDTTAVVATLLALCLTGQLLLLAWLALKLLSALGAFFLSTVLGRGERRGDDSTPDKMLPTTPDEANCSSAGTHSHADSHATPPWLSDTDSEVPSHPTTTLGADGVKPSEEADEPSALVDVTTHVPTALIADAFRLGKHGLNRHMGDEAAVARCLDRSFEEISEGRAMTSTHPMPSATEGTISSAVPPFYSEQVDTQTPPTPEFSWCSSGGADDGVSQSSVGAAGDRSPTPSFSFASEVDGGDGRVAMAGEEVSSRRAVGEGGSTAVMHQRRAGVGVEPPCEQQQGEHFREISVDEGQVDAAEGGDISIATPEVIDLLSSDDDLPEPNGPSRCELSTPQTFWDSFQVDLKSNAAAMTKRAGASDVETLRSQTDKLSIATPVRRLDATTSTVASTSDFISQPAGGSTPVDDGIGCGEEEKETLEEDVVLIPSSARRTVQRQARVVLSDSDSDVGVDTDPDPYALLDVASSPPDPIPSNDGLGCNRTPQSGLVPWVRRGSATRSHGMTDIGRRAKNNSGTVGRSCKTTAAMTVPSLLHRSMTPSKQIMTPAAFKRQRATRAAELFKEYNERIFLGQLPVDLEISWNVNLKTTAGLTHLSRRAAVDPSDFLAPMAHRARVELSTKVVDDEEKLRNTLCHELCHAAAWLIDHTAKPPHGPVFKKWAAAAMEAYPTLNITTCHQYKIHHAFRWQCTACNKEYGRHSNSIDTSRQVCGDCKGLLVSLGKFKPDGTPAAKRKASAYSHFVAANFASVRAELGGNPEHADVMKAIAARWRVTQAGGDGLTSRRHQQSTTPLSDATNLHSNCQSALA